MTIAQILESHNWRRRKDLVNKVFTPDAVFWHPFFIVHGRHDILGIYQLWGANNVKINVTYDRVVPDSANNVVVVDLLETVRVWWIPLTWFGVPMNFILHTVFDVEQTPEGYIYKRQEDHALVLESLMYSNPLLTLGLPYLLKNYICPASGRLAAASGNYLHRVFDTSGKQGRQQNARVGMMDLTRELSKAMEVIGAGNDAHRVHMMNSVYSDDMTFWHPALTVAGKQDLLGVARLWTFLFKDLEVYTRRVVPSYSEDVMLIDLERRFRPRLYPVFFPPIVLWVHVIVHLVGAQGPHGGKLISRHEEHIMWEESLLMRNLGPLSHVFHDYFRPFMGKLFSTLGNLIYHFLVWLDLPKEKKLE